MPSPLRPKLGKMSRSGEQLHRIAADTAVDMRARDCLFDDGADILEVVLDVAIRQAQDAEALFSEVAVAAFVVVIGVIVSMRFAVEFEDEAMFVADEINDVRANGLLPLEFPRRCS